jgi:hypothetical protein
MSTDSERIDWKWNVQAFPHRAHDEAFNKLLQLQAEALVLTACSTPTGGVYPHNAAYFLQRECEKLKIANDAARDEIEAKNNARGYHEGYRAGVLRDKAVKAVTDAFAQESAQESA